MIIMLLEILYLPDKLEIIRNTWRLIVVNKLFVLRIVTWGNSCQQMIIISNFKAYKAGFPVV